MNWKRVIAKEWLIIITLTISLPLAGYGIFLYQNRLYEKEQATIKAFNPSRTEIVAYLKSKDQRAQQLPSKPISEMSVEELPILKQLERWEEWELALAFYKDSEELPIVLERQGRTVEFETKGLDISKQALKILADLSVDGFYKLKVYVKQQIGLINQQAKDEMLAKLIPHQRSRPSVESNLWISVVSIPFLYLCLAILRITYWSVKTVRRRQLSIQTNSSYQLPPTAIATDSFC